MKADRTPGETGPCGLRERKKRRTRDALIRAALELFTEHGYEHTTIDEIADAVDVSQRTFFRYFTTKEDVVFAPQEIIEARFLEELQARPAHEVPLQALRNAVLHSWEDIGRTIGTVIPVELHMRTYQMIESTPALVAAHLRRGAELEEQIAGVIARRERLDVAADPRPRIVVAAFGGVMRLAGRVWGEAGDCSPASMRAGIESYLDGMEPAISGQWPGEWRKSTP